eukprot:g703.t1
MSKTNEIHSIRKKVENIVGATVEASIDEYVAITLSESRFRTVKIGFKFPPTYPDEPLLTELTSHTIGKGLLRKWTFLSDNVAKDIVSKAKKLPPSPPDNNCNSYEQIIPCVLAIQKQLKTNLLAPALPEIRSLAKNPFENTKLLLREDEGIIVAKSKIGQYNFVAEITVPPDYPDEAVSVQVKKSDFPWRLVQTALAQSREVARRCLLGFSVDAALSGGCGESWKGPPKGSKASGRKGKSAEVPLDLSSKGFRDLKADVRMLKRRTDLKKVNTQRNEFDGRKYEHSSQARKFARRELRAIEEKELKKEEELAKKAREQALVRARAAGGLSDTPTLSLIPVIRCIIEKFVLRLCKEKCQGCGKKIIPADPVKLKQIYENVQSEKKPIKRSGGGALRKCAAVAPEVDLYDKARPERLYCGHYFHFGCLDVALTSPPFLPEGKKCPACGLRLYHRKWTSDIKKLERRWAAKERGKRELNETAEFLDLGEQFTRAKVADPDQLAGFDTLF